MRDAMRKSIPIKGSTSAVQRDGYTYCTLRMWQLDDDGYTREEIENRAAKDDKMDCGDGEKKRKCNEVRQE